MKRVIASSESDEKRWAMGRAVGDVIQEMDDDEFRYFYNDIVVNALGDASRRIEPMSEFNEIVAEWELDYIDIAQMAAESKHFDSHDEWFTVIDEQYLWSSDEWSTMYDRNALINTILAHPDYDYASDDINAVLHR